MNRKLQVVATFAGSLALAFQCSKCEMDQPHVHVESAPFENTVSTLSYPVSSNVAARVFGFDGTDPRIGGFDVGRFV